MKTMRTRWIACLLVCAVGVACTACGKNDGSSTSKNNNGGNNNSASVGDGDESSTFNSEELAAMQKQPMEFSYAVEDDDTGNVDVPVNQGVEQGNNNNNNNENSGNDYVVVTDTAGQPVVDENGNTVTEPAANANNGNAGNNNSASGNDENNGNDGNAYTQSITSFQAYWLDMSLGKDYIFNGDFLDVTFKIKENTPDGVYALTSGSSDYANWDAEHVECAFIDGAIAVGNAAVPETGTAQSGTFSVVAGTAQGNPGDEVTVRFDMSDNPGLVALIFRFKYDQNALEIVDAVVGDDCAEYVTVSQ